MAAVTNIQAVPTPRILLTGATGDVGSQVLDLLRITTNPLRVQYRKQSQVDHAQASSPSNGQIEFVQADLISSPSILASSWRGCTTLFLLTAASPTQLEQNINAIDAAIDAGITWIVRISAADARDDGNVPWVKAHAAADRYLRRKCSEYGVVYTILAASAFMSNLLPSAPAIQRGILPQTSGSGRAGWIDTADVAAVSASILQSRSAVHANQQYILTGPALLSIPDIARVMSSELDHRVRYLHLPGPLFGMLLQLSGIDAWTAKGLVAQFVEIIRPDKEGVEVSDAVQQILGRPPKGFKEFVRERKEDLSGRDIVRPAVVGGTAVVVSVLAWRVYVHWL